MERRQRARYAACLRRARHSDHRVADTESEALSRTRQNSRLGNVLLNLMQRFVPVICSRHTRRDHLQVPGQPN